MTPIIPGTASRLGLRKPLPPLEMEISGDVEALNRSLRDVREFMERNDAMILVALANLQNTMRSVR